MVGSFPPISSCPCMGHSPCPPGQRVVKVTSDCCQGQDSLRGCQSLEEAQGGSPLSRASSQCSANCRTWGAALFSLDSNNRVNGGDHRYSWQSCEVLSCRTADVEVFGFPQLGYSGVPEFLQEATVSPFSQVKPKHSQRERDCGLSTVLLSECAGSQFMRVLDGRSRVVGTPCFLFAPSSCVVGKDAESSQHLGSQQALLVPTLVLKT